MWVSSFLTPARPPSTAALLFRIRLQLIKEFPQKKKKKKWNGMPASQHSARGKGDSAVKEELNVIVGREFRG